MNKTLLTLVGVVVSALFAFLYGLVKGRKGPTSSVIEKTQTTVTEAKTEAKTATTLAKKAVTEKRIVEAALEVISSSKKSTTSAEDLKKDEEAKNKANSLIGDLMSLVSDTEKHI